MGMGGQSHTTAALPLGKTRYPLYRRTDGPQDWSRWVRKISLRLGFDPRTVQHASGYTDRAIPAHYKLLYRDITLPQCLEKFLSTNFTIKKKRWIKWWHELWMWHGNSKWHVITKFMNTGIRTQNPRRWDCCRKRHMCSQIHHVPPISATPSLYFRRFPPASPLPVPAVHSTVHKSEQLSSKEFSRTEGSLLHTNDDSDVAAKLRWRPSISHYSVIDWLIYNLLVIRWGTQIFLEFESSAQTRHNSGFCH